MPRPRKSDRTTAAPRHHRWVVDRLGEATASVEHDGDHVYDIPRALIPEGTQEGEVLAVVATLDDDGVTVRVRRDAKATLRSKRESSKQLRAAKGRGGKGDVTL